MKKMMKSLSVLLAAMALFCLTGCVKANLNVNVNVKPGVQEVKKNSGVKRTASVSLGENLKYNRNIRTNTINAKSAHSVDNSKRCPVINNAAINTIKLGVRIEHKSDAIRTITKFLRLSMYPNLPFIMRIVIRAKRNFHA